MGCHKAEDLFEDFWFNRDSKANKHTEYEAVETFIQKHHGTISSTSL